MLAVTIIVMGLGTFLIGLLPTYQQIGVAAPVLLVVLRFLQGIGLGGEWGGAVLMVVENAPKHRRGLFGSMVQIGNPIGNLAAIGMFALVSQLRESEFMAWGWRIPFLISVLLVGVGLWIRLRMEETPAFRQIKARNEVAKMPVLDIFKYHRRPFFIAVVPEDLGDRLCQHRRRLRDVVCDSRSAFRAGSILNSAFIASLSRCSRSPVWMDVGQDGPQDDVLCQLPVLGRIRIPTVLAARHPRSRDRHPDHRGRDHFGQMVMFGIGAPWYSELFTARLRYSGASLGFQVGAALSGGLTPADRSVTDDLGRRRSPGRCRCI